MRGEADSDMLARLNETKTAQISEDMAIAIESASARLEAIAARLEEA